MADTPAPAAGGATPVVPAQQPVDGTKPKSTETYKKQMTRTKVTVTCDNPRKSKTDREKFVMSNSVVGTQEYEVIFGEKLNLPKVIIDVIKDKTCMLKKTIQDAKQVNREVLQLGKEFTVTL